MDVFRAVAERSYSLAGVLLGATTQVVFLVTVWFLFSFLWNTPGRPTAHAIAIDLLLSLQFAISHSVWLYPPVRKWLGRWISRAFYGCFFCLMTCLSLGLTFSQWRAVPTLVWSLNGRSGQLIGCAFLGIWIALLYSLALTGLGYQTGLTEWIHWLRGRAIPTRKFEPRGAYRFLRHPVYLSFLGLLWFVPTMTLDHLVVSSVWSAYIFVGSCLKDQRLVFYLGDRYRQYASLVPGYPLVFVGPLAKWRLCLPEPADASMGSCSDRTAATGKCRTRLLPVPSVASTASRR